MIEIRPATIDDSETVAGMARALSLSDGGKHVPVSVSSAFVSSAFVVFDTPPAGGRDLPQPNDLSQ